MAKSSPLPSGGRGVQVRLPWAEAPAAPKARTRAKMAPVDQMARLMSMTTSQAWDGAYQVHLRGAERLVVGGMRA